MGEVLAIRRPDRVAKRRAEPPRSAAREIDEDHTVLGREQDTPAVWRQREIGGGWLLRHDDRLVAGGHPFEAVSSTGIDGYRHRAVVRCCESRKVACLGVVIGQRLLVGREPRGRQVERADEERSVPSERNVAVMIEDGG